MKRRNALLIFGFFVLVAVIAVVATADVTEEAPVDNGTRGAADNTYMDSATYVGSSTCEGCHQAKYDTWEVSLHNKKVMPAVAENVIGDFTIDPEISGVGTIDLYYNATADTYHAIVGSTNYTIKWALGSGYWKQRYMVEIGISTYILPIQYNTATQEWVGYHPENWNATTGNTTSFDNSWEKNCMGCHVTGYEVTEEPDGQWNGTYSELNVGCEGCHGPGSDHVSPPSGKDRTDYIWLDYSSDTCSLCHVRGKSKDGDHGFPEGMLPGDSIYDFYDMGSDLVGLHDDGNTSTKHHQQWLDWNTTSVNGHAQVENGVPGYFATAGREGCMKCRSVEGFLDNLDQWDKDDDIPEPQNATWQQTCVSCHDTHTEADQTVNEHQLRLEREEICTACHTADGAAETSSPHHAQKEVFNGTTPAGVLGEEGGEPMMLGEVTCADCHMPKTAKSAVPNDISSHTFKAIEPEYALEYDMPDSCTLDCHTTMSQENAQEIIDTWEDRFEKHFEEAEEIFEHAAELRNAALENGTLPDTVNTSYHKANHNLHLSEYGAGGIHNPNFLEDLLSDVIAHSESIIEELSTGTITGTITDGTNPVSGVFVVAGEGGDTTAADGTYSIEVGASAEGESYTVTAYVGGYGVYTSAEVVAVPPGGSVTHDISLNMDTDNDGVPDSEDTDDDGDGVLDDADFDDADPTEWTDTDGDGTGNNADTDDDGDGVIDTEDTAPLDETVTTKIGEGGDDEEADTTMYLVLIIVLIIVVVLLLVMYMKKGGAPAPQPEPEPEPEPDEETEEEEEA